MRHRLNSITFTGQENVCICLGVCLFFFCLFFLFCFFVVVVVVIVFRIVIVA